MALTAISHRADYGVGLNKGLGLHYYESKNQIYIATQSVYPGFARVNIIIVNSTSSNPNNSYIAIQKVDTLWLMSTWKMAFDISTPQIYILMKKSDEFGSPTSPASFLKKQSHIITNNGVSQEYFQLTPNTRYELQGKQMHRSHFHSEANSTKLMDDQYFDQHDMLDMYSEGKEKANEEECNKNVKPNKVQRQPFESFYQSDEMSSQHENSQTRSHKKFVLSANTLSEKVIKRVSNNRQDKFLVINSKKQRYNNNYLFLSDIDALKEQIKKYQISIQKLKEENFKLRSQKIKLSSTNESMQLIQSRLQLQSIKKKIKQLQTQKEMHLTINMQKDQKSNFNVPLPISHHSGGFNPMAASCLETPSKNSEREEIPKRNIPTFRVNQDKQSELVEDIGAKGINSPRNRHQKDQKGQIANPSYKILQNMKSPYFLKKT